ncbi:transcription factor E3 isoform X2 [Cherax quadricarinatus]|uniref:transcription factor E3 isoform X2 n=1 Tax=Cherax quadricarinatus TaxID=27406 RepID=UPI002379E3B3|nr:transcription factor E3-like isoform X2 [Cherax quadricarinatus]
MVAASSMSLVNTVLHTAGNITITTILVSATYIHPCLSISHRPREAVAHFLLYLLLMKSLEHDIVEEILKLEEEMQVGGSSQRRATTIPAVSLALLAQPDVALPSCLYGTSADLHTASTSYAHVPEVTSEASASSSTATVCMKNKRRKENRNMFERKRRTNINERIKELASLLPRRNEPYFEVVRDLRHSTGQILKASVNYIRRLKVDVEHSKKIEAQRLSLEQENQRLLARIKVLEAKLQLLSVTTQDVTSHPGPATTPESKHDRRC